MLNEENKEKLKEIIMKDKKMSEKEIDNILNNDYIFNGDNGLWALMILALLFSQPNMSQTPPINININSGDGK